MRNLVGGLILAVVILLVAGLLTMAGGRMQDKAARISCAYKLSNIAMAAVNRADTNRGQFVQAARPNPNLAVEKRLSWLFEITPYIESASIYYDVEKDKPWDDENRFAALTNFNWFVCPAFPERNPESTFVSSHYIGIAGLGRDAAELPNNDPRAGLLGYERTIQYGSHLSTSTLLLAMETTRVSGAWTAAGPPTVRGLEPDGSPYLGINGQFGGIHRGIANAVFADGSVRSLRNSMDPKVLEAIATIKGRERVPRMDELGERIDINANLP